MYFPIYEKLLHFAQNDTLIDYSLKSLSDENVSPLTLQQRRRIHELANMFGFVNWGEGAKNARYVMVSKDEALREKYNRANRGKSSIENQGKFPKNFGKPSEDLKHFPYKEELELYEFSKGHWKQYERPKRESEKKSSLKSPHNLSKVKFTFTVLTLNVLFDVIDSSKTYTTKRIPLLLKLLQKHQPDLVGLQEMTPSILQYVLDDDNIRKKYIITDVTGSTLRPYGVLVMIRRKKMIPLDAHVFRFSTYKQYSLVSFDLRHPDCPGKVDRFLFQAVHLTAGREKFETRKMQVRILQEESRDFDLCIQAGDFNFSDATDSNTDVGISREFCDSWLEHHDLNTSPGYTFNPELNHFAKHNSRSKQPSRLDRIFYKSTGSLYSMKCEDIEIVANEKETFLDESRLSFKGGLEVGLYVSDHFGLLGTYSLESKMLEE